MGINTDKNSYTLLFAIGMVIIVGTLLAAIDSSLRERIDTNKILDCEKSTSQPFQTLLEVLRSIQESAPE